MLENVCHTGAPIACNIYFFGGDVYYINPDHPADSSFDTLLFSMQPSGFAYGTSLVAVSYAIRGASGISWSTPGGVCPVMVSSPVLDTAAGDSKVMLTWTAATKCSGHGTLVYDIRRGTVSPPGTVIASNLTTLSYLDTGRTNGITYFYRVTAKWVEIPESGLSNIAQATPAVSRETWGAIGR